MCLQVHLCANIFICVLTGAFLYSHVTFVLTGAFLCLQVTFVPFVPPVVLSLLHYPESSNYDLSSIKRISCGAAPLSRETQLEFKQFIDVGDIRQGMSCVRYPVDLI